MAAVTICSDFGTQENSLSLFPLFLHLFAMKWWDRMLWSLFFEYLSFKPAFSLSFFSFIKRLFTSSLLFAIRVVSSAYLRLLMFLGIRRCIYIPGGLFCFLSKILSVQCTSPFSCCWGLSASVGGPMRQEPSWSYPSFLFGVITFGPQDTLQPGNPERASQHPPTHLYLTATALSAYRKHESRTHHVCCLPALQ